MTVFCKIVNECIEVLLYRLLFSLFLMFSREINFTLTKDTHYTRGRCFNTERANLFSDIKQPAQFSSYLASRNSLLIIPFTTKALLQVIQISRGRCFNTERATLFSDIKQPAQLARISYFVARSCISPSDTLPFQFVAELLSLTLESKTFCLSSPSDTLPPLGCSSYVLILLLVFVFTR